MDRSKCLRTELQVFPTSTGYQRIPPGGSVGEEIYTWKGRCSHCKVVTEQKDTCVAAFDELVAVHNMPVSTAPDPTAAQQMARKTWEYMKKRVEVAIQEALKRAEPEFQLTKVPLPWLNNVINHLSMMGGFKTAISQEGDNDRFRTITVWVTPEHV